MTPLPGIPVSVLIPVLNEELNIREALESVRWADEIWVVDSQSTDRTVEIASAYTDRIVQFHFNGSWPKKKNWSLENLPFGNEWVFILDADERIPDPLRDEIGRVIRNNDHDGYFVDRDFIFLGRSLGCFRPNWNLRLFKHGLGRYENLKTEDVSGVGDNEVHEHVMVRGRVGHLRHAIIHEDRKTLRAWLDRHNRYSSWDARVYLNFLEEDLNFNLGTFLRLEPAWRKRFFKRVWVRLPLRPIIRFFWFYGVKRGFLDGRQGFIFSVLMAMHEYIISVKMWEIQHQESTAIPTADRNDKEESADGLPLSRR